MNKKRIFIIAQDDKTFKYGVGTYVKEILEHGKNETAFEIVLVLLASLHKTVIVEKTNNNTKYFYIPKPVVYDNNQPDILSYSYSKALYVLLNDFFTIGENDVFHFNDVTQYVLLNDIKAYTTAKIIYTIHVSLLKTFYGKNKVLQLQDFSREEDGEDSIYKRSINTEIQNCELADKVICLSDDMLDDIVNTYKTSMDKVQKINNGISPQNLSYAKREIDILKRKINIRPDDFLLLYVGRIETNKGVQFLIESFNTLLKKGYDRIHLLIVGDGMLKKKLEKDVCGFKDKITFSGYVAPEDIYQYYSMADAMVFPSLNEQSSYVMLEAMSFKLPLIVTNITAFNILEDNWSCLKARVTNNAVDLEELTSKMEVFIGDRTLRNRIAERAYSLFLEKYTAKKMFDQTYSDLFE
ncbi:glycosyltransferase family 4 protein [Snuella sedimenti]|uniref:Glycosyltransferase n=1 Tax=Snuella sedimenti TaxID=2798802 RepID=A0A8J7IMI6_9FLAO|nr:glycosyltransferase family 4 protein [Snuella sedimenti]MBJ6367257.1 glycosyltransferase [Snuella sedimenti]